MKHLLVRVRSEASEPTSRTADSRRFSINQRRSSSCPCPNWSRPAPELGVPRCGPVACPGRRSTASRRRRSCSATRASPSPPSAAAASSPRSTRRSARAALADNRAADRRGGRRSAPTPSSWSRAACPAGAKDLYGARERIADALAELGPYAERARRAAGHRAAPPDVRLRPLRGLHARPRPSTSRSASPPTRSASSSTRTTSGGTTRRPRRSPAPARAAGSTPSSSPTGSTPLPEGVLIGRGQIGDGCDRHARVARRTSRRPVTRARSRSSCSTTALWARDGREVLAETAARFVEHAA